MYQILWHQQRIGRITGSVAHSVLHTDINNFSESLLMKICCPNTSVINAPSLNWGRDHESVANKIYTSLITGSQLPSDVSFPNNIYVLVPTGHIGCSVMPAGFRISSKMSYIGVSADGYVKCDCQGTGVIEIKCPNTDRNTPLSTLLTKPDILFNANYNVRRNHKYYCQIQLEMYVCGVLYCDVVIWQPDSILVVRVERDDSFLTDVLPNLRTAWIKHILPELLTKSIQTAPRASASAATCTVTTASASGNDYRFCVCKTDIGGRMIG